MNKKTEKGKNTKKRKKLKRGEKLFMKEEMKKSFARISKEKGITLVALVITIVILIILATVTINFAFGEDGIIARAQQAKEITEQATKEEQEQLNSLMDEYSNILAEDSEIQEPEGPIIDGTVEESKQNKTVFDKKVTIQDEKGNTIVVPEGFKIAEDSGDTVQQGIVIEDAFSEDENVRGSQYVWIPVGKFIKDDGTESNEIVLGRYTFNRSNGTPRLQQAAYTDDNPTNYRQSVVIDSYFSELSTYRVGKASDGKDGLNATAYDLEAWVNSVKANGGYYIGRYEASYASGSSTSNYKAASKISKNFSEDSMSYKSGTLWNNITQLGASKVAINTYKNSSNGVRSDLMNSYAWDTAIVYIQEAGNTNYANKTSVNSSLANTGANKDEVCKINDMASNCFEWTTEYSSLAVDNLAFPCVGRGGIYGNSYVYTARRNYDYYATNSLGDVLSFRLSLYLV